MDCIDCNGFSQTKAENSVFLLRKLLLHRGVLWEKNVLNWEVFYIKRGQVYSWLLTLALLRNFCKSGSLLINEYVFNCPRTTCFAASSVQLIKIRALEQQNIFFLSSFNQTGRETSLWKKWMLDIAKVYTIMYTLVGGGKYG